MDDMMSGDDATAIFEGQRTHLRAVAYRLLGSVHEADDAVQETWLRLERSDVAEIENLPAWLTTVVSRICLDQLRSRTARREDLGADLTAPGARPAARRAGPGSGGRGRAGRRRRPRPARRPRHPRARRAAGLLPARPVRAVLRRDRDHPRPQQHGLSSAGQSRPAPGARAGCGRGGGSSPAPRGGRGLPGRLPQRDFDRLLGCCTPMRWWPPTPRPWPWARPPCCGGPTRWRSSTTDAPAPPGRPSSTGTPRPSGRCGVRSRPSSRSPCRTAGSSRSSCWPASWTGSIWARPSRAPPGLEPAVGQHRDGLPYGVHLARVDVDHQQSRLGAQRGEHLAGGRRPRASGRPRWVRCPASPPRWSSGRPGRRRRRSRCCPAPAPGPAPPTARSWSAPRPRTPVRRSPGHRGRRGAVNSAGNRTS